MKKAPVLLLSLCCLCSLLSAHGVKLKVSQQPPCVVVEAAYHAGRALVGADVTVSRPGEPKAFQKGRTDVNGFFLFRPHEAGQWQVMIDDGMGHRGKSTIEVTADFFAPPRQEEPAVKTVDPPAVNAGAVDKVEPGPLEAEKKKTPPVSSSEICCYLLKIVLGAGLILVVTFVLHRLVKKQGG